MPATPGLPPTRLPVREMLIGSNLEFDQAGTHDLKGFEEPWTLYRASRRS